MVNLKYFKIFEREIYLKESTEIKNVLNNSFSVKNYKSKSCDIKYTEPGAKNYWNVNAPDEFSKKLQRDQKIDSVKKRIDPIFKSTKEYYIKYTGSPYFTKKIGEKSKKQGRKWGPANKASLDKFINSIYYLTYPPNDLPFGFSEVLGWVSPTVWDTGKYVPAYNLININIEKLTNNFSEKEMMDVLVHEMRHCIDAYFSNQGLDIVPGNDDYAGILDYINKIGVRKLTPAEDKFLEDYSGTDYSIETRRKKYRSNEMENSARYQRLKSDMGVDDFGTFENFISLLKKNLTAEDKEWNRKNLRLEKIKDFKLDFTEDGKLKISANPSDTVFYFYDKKEINDDIRILIEGFQEKNTNQNETIINLKKLYNHSLQFAKNDSNKEENREQRA
jgi:hypothetical protein